MFYKAPDVPPKFSVEHNDNNIKNFDEKLPLLGGGHHPWRRFFSRIVEVTIIGSMFSICLNTFLGAIIPKQLDQLLLMIDSTIILGVVFYFAFIPFEAMMLSIFGTTPAKWLFGIRVLSPAGKPLSLWRAIIREFLVFAKGMFFGVPFVNLLPQIFAYFRLIKTGATSWDKSTGAVVVHKKWGFVRALICTAITIFSMILTSAIIASAY